MTYKYDNQTLPTGAPSFTRGSSIGRLVAVTYGTGSAGSYQGYDQGTVPDETQSPLSRVFGQRRIPYQKVVTTDYVSYWAGEAMLNPVIGAKADIKLINWIVKAEGLSLVQRELLHEEINAVTRMGGGKLTKDEIIELAKQVAKDYPNK